MSDNISSIILELSNLNPPQKSFDNKLILQALAVINNPQNCYKVIHIAGTNGKGSTAAFIESGLLRAGYKVAKYSSPYIQHMNECICIDKEKITDQCLADLYLEHKLILEREGIYLSSFEMLTLLMFVYCARESIDYLVLEAGLGGRDDATNVVDSIVSVITNISLEHTQFLGSTLQSIASHKAGIIKNGFTLIGDDHPDLINAVLKQTRGYTSIKDKYSILDVELDYSNFKTNLIFKDNVSSETKHVLLGLFGYFQVSNFLCAYEVLRYIGIPWEVIRNSANDVVWRGRLEKLSDNPFTIADASHNVDGVRNLFLSLKSWFPYNGSVIVCSILSDKNISEMIDYYSKISESIIFCGIPDQERSSNPEDLMKIARGKFKHVVAVDTPQEAHKYISQRNYHSILISGSCYLLKYFIYS